MISSSLDDYIHRLERQLRQRGIVDSRILAEAREHLVDAVEDGRERGLSVSDAEHEAFERFGAPEIIAAQALEERDRMKIGFAGMFVAMWQRKWWILAPTVLAAVVTGLTTYYFVPARYQSEVRFFVVSPYVQSDLVHTSGADLSTEQRQRITSTAGSRVRLERIIEDFNLYEEERKATAMQQVADQMRRDVHIDFLSPNVFSLSFVSADPTTALRVTERLATYLIDESLKSSAVRAESTYQFIEAQIKETHGQIVDYEARLKTLREHRGGVQLSQADLIPYETLKEKYKALLDKSQDARMAANLERRQLGERFRILDPARLPESPVGPSRLRVIVVGALAGLAIGLALVVLRRSPNARPPTLAQA